MEESIKSIGSDPAQQIEEETQTESQEKREIIQLWADKYSPKHLTDVVGNLQIIKSINTWIQNWEKDCLNNNSRKGKGEPKAVLLSGPPGIGKTTLVKLLGKHTDYSVHECNASDVRNKKLIIEELQPIIHNRY